MNHLQTAFSRLVLDLRALRLEWALVGGMAVTVRSRPRTTEDLDVVIAVLSDREAEKIARDFWARGYRYSSEPLVEQTYVNRLATVRLLAPGEEEFGVVVDLLFASSGIETEIVASAENLEILPGLFAPVARTGHLLAMKVLAGREQDLADFRWLYQAADDAEKLLAEEALSLIARRGYHRGKDLLAEWGRLRAGSEHA